MDGYVSSEDDKREIDELKEQMKELMKMLKALQKEKAPSVEKDQPVLEEITQNDLPYPPGFVQIGNPHAAGPSHQQNDGSNLPPYGLPAGYVPHGYVPPQEGGAHNNLPHGQPNLEQPAAVVDPTDPNENPNYIPPQMPNPNQNMPFFKDPSAETHHKASGQGPLFASSPGLGREELDKLNMLEEKMKVMERASYPDLKEAFDMCLVPDVVLPPKFKAPDFEKYNGTTCPKNHLHMFVRKMTAYHRNDKLMIHCFQDSLVGMALSWYIDLEKTQIKSFRDLANAFVIQYKYNENAAPDRVQLQNMSKLPSESFKEYVQRWRGVASQVKPRLEEDEQLEIFLETLQSPYYDRLVGLATLGFNALAKAGEMIEAGMKKGKIVDDQASVAKKPNFMRKKEGETNSVNSELKMNQGPQPNYQNPYPNPYTPQLYQALYPSYPYIATNTHQYHAQPPYPQQRPYNNQPYFPQQRPYNNQPYHPRPNQNTYQAPNTNPAQNQNNNFQNPPRRNPQFDPIPMSYADLFPYLQSRGAVSTVEGRVINPPYPKWYDPAASCAYHRGIAGHSIENCRDLKYKVQDLINSKWLDFKQATPNTTGNPLPNHEK